MIAKKVTWQRWISEGTLGKIVRWIAVATTVGMFLVLVMGATVTNTGSAEGCGRSWPLCHGKFIPSMAVSTAIEFSHRAVTGVESVLVFATAGGAWLLWRKRREVRYLAPAMIFFLFLQAGLGAWAVLYPQQAAVLALHFGVSLTAFASVLLTLAFLFEVGGAETVRDRPVPTGLRRFIWACLAYTYLLVYLGAYVRHSDASLACGDWPLCNDQVVPGLSGSVGVAFFHRFAALIGSLLIVGLVIWTYRYRAERPDLFRGSLVALAMIFLQAVSGAIVVWAQMDLFSTLLHAALVSLLFGTLSYLCYHTLPRPIPAAAPESPPERAPATLELGTHT